MREEDTWIIALIISLMMYILTKVLPKNDNKLIKNIEFKFHLLTNGIFNGFMLFKRSIIS